ncbi:MAG: leucine-rich repeat domain-containing protein [Bacteroidota bacterium]
MSWTVKENIPPRPESIFDIIEGDPAEVKTLELSERGLEVLPDDIERLINLTGLFVRGNRLSDLPLTLARLPSLRYLSVASNAVSAFPPVLLLMSGLVSLNLAYNPLTVIPREIAALQDLRQLWLYQIDAEDLPVEIGELPLDSFGLSVWTAASQVILARLTTLQSLTLDRIGPAEVEAALALAPADLRDLTLMHNGLESMPAAVGRMELTALQLYGQKLSAFPDIQPLSQLTNLALAFNGLTEIPPWIGSLSTLRSLYLAGNKIRTLPRALADLGDDFSLYLSGNPLEPPLDTLAQQGTPALFSYLRSLPDQAPVEATDPERVTRELPEQRPAPLAARIVDGRLTLARTAPPEEVDEQELAVMHAEVRDWGLGTLTRVSNNHPLLYGMIERYLELLGENVEDMEILPLGFAANRLECLLDKYFEEDGRDPLSMEQRGMCEALLGNHGMMINWTKQWQDYKKKAESTPLSAEAVGQIHGLLSHLAAALRQDRDAVDPAVPAALTEIAAAAAPADNPDALASQGAADSLHNTLSPLARAALLITKEDRAEARKTMVRWVTNTAIGGGVTLAVVGGSFFLSHPVDLLALAQLLPSEFSWLRQVIAALRAMSSNT